MMFFKKKINTSSILELIQNRNRLKRYTILIFGILLTALSYNMFFLPNDIVVGGVSGIAIILNKELNIDPASFIMIVSILLLFLSYATLGKEKTAGSVLGSLLFPVFVKITSELIIMFDLQSKIGNNDLLLTVILGAILGALGSGIILKEGFSTGGTDIINQITVKYFHVSMGTAMIINDGVIVLSGLFFFGIVPVMYAVFALYIMSILTDKVILGISESKMLYIITVKEDEIKQFIMDNLNVGLTIFDAQSGLIFEKKKVLMCVIPTKEYFKLKEGILKIDKESFFIATDSYQVLGGH